MDRDKFLEKIKEIGSCESDDERRTMLTEISDEVTKIYDNNDALNTKINSLNETITKNNVEMERIQKKNMEMWLKLEDQKKQNEVLEDSTGIKKEEEKTYKSYDELANEFMK